MKDLEKARAQTEALENSKSRPTNSASRNRFWAGLNRYLETEVEHERKAATQGREEATRQMRAPSRSTE